MWTFLEFLSLFALQANFACIYRKSWEGKSPAPLPREQDYCCVFVQDPAVSESFPAPPLGIEIWGFYPSSRHSKSLAHSWGKKGSFYLSPRRKRFHSSSSAVLRKERFADAFHGFRFLVHVQRTCGVADDVLCLAPRAAFTPHTSVSIRGALSGPLPCHLQSFLWAPGRGTWKSLGMGANFLCGQGSQF